MPMRRILMHFNPRSPHGERPPTALSAYDSYRTFQPTLPARGATPVNRVVFAIYAFQPTLPARGATQITMRQATTRAISTHAPRTGSDLAETLKAEYNPIISTHAPRTGSDIKCERRYPIEGGISTHAPRTGSDQECRSDGQGTNDFNPRSPHGERPQQQSVSLPTTYFNPRSPHGERRVSGRTFQTPPGFQPTLPARGATTLHRPHQRQVRHFNPRSPHGERRAHARRFP